MKSNDKTDSNSDDRIDELEKQVKIQQTQIEALNRWIEEIETLLLGSFETDDVDVGSVNFLQTVQDLQTAMGVVSSRVEQIEQAPGSGAKATRIAKIRRVLVRGAKRSGKATVSQAAQESTSSMDANRIQTLFKNNISRSYASELVEDAADGKAFWVQRKPIKGNPNDKKVLRVDVTELGIDSPYRSVDEHELKIRQISELSSIDDELHAEGGEEER